MSSMPINIIILEMRKLETWRNAFLRTTELVSGKTGLKARREVPKWGIDVYPADNPCSLGETNPSLIDGQLQGTWVFLHWLGRSPLEVSP